jgi:nucleotide sugar dehydrogenase
LYSAVFSTVVAVSSPEVAEMTKLYENCQRMLCIAYANEMADACHDQGIDAYEVARAAATKPFGFSSYTPGLGVGGHCIPVNPYYLLTNCNFPLLEAATQKMWQRPAEMGDRLMEELSLRKRKIPKELHRNHTKCTHGRRPSMEMRPHVLVVGAGFKRGQSVTSNSPGLSLLKHLVNNYDVYVEYADPLVPQEAVRFAPKLDEDTDWNTENLQSRFDAVVVALDQDGLDMAVLENLDETVLVHDFSPRRTKV